MKNALKIMTILMGLVLFVIVLLQSVELATFNEKFFKKEFAKLNVAQSIGISETDLERVTKNLLDYMKGDIDDLNLEIDINGQTRYFFSEREILHMIDVEELFQNGYFIRNIGVIFLIIGLIISVMKSDKNLFFKNILIGYGLGFAILVVSALIISTDFNKYFTIFHEIFFDNDLWILDPSVDLLINIVPLQFFIDICIRLVTIFSILSILIIGFGTGNLLYIKNKSVLKFK